MARGAEEEEKAAGLGLSAWVLARDGHFQHTAGAAAGLQWPPKGLCAGTARGAEDSWAPELGPPAR